MNQKQIIRQLSKSKNKNISLIGVIENYGIESSFQAGDSLLITVKTDHLWCYPAVECEKDLKELLGKFQYQTLYFASLEEWMLPIIDQQRKFEWELKTERLILPEKIVVSNNNSLSGNKKFMEKDFKIRELKAEDTDFIFSHSHYQQFTSKAYIKERIAADCSIGIFLADELAGWGLTHDDGALGFIHVRKSFRKKGLAHLIMEQLIRDKRSNKRNIFLNVEPNNSKAKKLFYSLGFKFDRMISWIKLKD